MVTIRASLLCLGTIFMLTVTSSGKKKEDVKEGKTAGPDWENWMKNSMEWFGKLTLKKICLPGTNEAGMYVKTGGSKIHKSCNTLCQSMDILKQLKKGIRYLDLRPIVTDLTYKVGHYQKEHDADWHGGDGPTFDKIIKQIDDFTKDHNELIVAGLSRSHSVSSNKPFTQEQWNSLLSIVSKTKNLFEGPEDNILKATVGEMTNNGNKSAVIYIVNAENITLGSFAGKGFFSRESVHLYDNVVDTDKMNFMFVDQSVKMSKHAHDSFFIYSWIVTQQPKQITQCPRLRSIKSLAKKTNPKMNDILSQVTQEAYPNVITANYFELSELLDISMAINVRWLPRRLVSGSVVKMVPIRTVFLWLNLISGLQIGKSALDTADWMSININWLGKLKLQQLCIGGSHNSGMNQITGEIMKEKACKVQTQDLSVAGQLQKGVRYLDLRPVLTRGKFTSGIYMQTYNNTWEGANGQSIKSIVEDINNFTREHNEMIIITLSNTLNLDAEEYKFNKSDWDNLFGLLNATENLFHAGPTSQLQNITLGEMTNNGTKAGVFYIVYNRGTDVELGELAGRGFFYPQNIDIYQRETETEDPLIMLDDQIWLMEKVSPNRYFILSFVLSQNHTKMCSKKRNKKKLAKRANKKLHDITQYVTELVHPNVISVDYVGESEVAEVAMIVNLRWFSKKVLHSFGSGR